MGTTGNCRIFRTFDFGLGSSEGGSLLLEVVVVGEVLEAPVGVLQERLGGPPGKCARLEEGLLLLLVLGDQLLDEHDLVLRVGGQRPRQPVVLALVLALQAVQHGANLMPKRGARSVSRFAK